VSEAQALEEEEVDVVSLFATESEEDDDGYEDEVESDDLDAVKERLAKRNKSLRKSKQAIHRVTEENKALLERLERIEQSMSNKSAPNAEVQQQEREKALAEWRDSVAENPEKAVDFATWQASQIQDSVVGYLAEMKREFASQLAEIRGATNPEKLKYEAELNMMRSNPEFDGLDDDVLLKFIRASKTANSKIPRGSLGGKRASVHAEDFKMNDDIRRAMGFPTKGE